MCISKLAPLKEGPKKKKNYHKYNLYIKKEIYLRAAKKKFKPPGWSIKLLD